MVPSARVVMGQSIIFVWNRHLVYGDDIRGTGSAEALLARRNRCRPTEKDNCGSWNAFGRGLASRSSSSTGYRVIINRFLNDAPSFLRVTDLYPITSPNQSLSGNGGHLG